MHIEVPSILYQKSTYVALRSVLNTSSIGYVVPVTVIRHFLQDLALHGGRYTGVCGLGARLQFLDNTQLRRHLLQGLESDSSSDSSGDDRRREVEALTGVRVISVAPLAPAAALLKTDDVLLSVDGINVSLAMTQYD